MAIDVEARKQEVLNLPCWKGKVEIQPLSGGLSNLNFLVSDDGKKFVVRMVGGDVPLHSVMRFNELEGLKAASKIGITPGIAYNEPGIIVIDFVEGKTYTLDDVRRVDNLKRILAVVRTLHDEAKHHIIGPCLGFWVFRVHRSYAQVLHKGKSGMLPKIPRFMEINDELERAVGAVQLTFCHNDLLPGNFIDSGEKIWVIDWEHSGYGAQLFDLSNIASNAALPEDTERELLEGYYGAPADNKLWRRYKAFRAASHLREAMWSMVSEIHLNLDVDYVEYTRQNLDAFEIAYAEYKKI
ncbi:MAG: hypothetical protein CFH06_01622 [Alphaproteobacteria bacterium MarineAlpha3_Bin5]|nr:choline kinase [Magnetovibrio sp.]PPR76809.1 MAG: hypothetical protein CFH06_01622 [Alphaproteobacteria bacterium MarineAlpha3_Bin5]